MRFGANYIPSGKWSFLWEDFDVNHVRSDFDDISSLGLDHVRLLPLWPALQPNRSHINMRTLDSLCQSIEVAKEFDLDVSVDAIQGHLSSFDFLPSWVTSWHRKNIFLDSEAIDAEKYLIDALRNYLGAFSNFLGITVGNEINQFSGPPHPDPMPISSTQAQAWLEDVLTRADDHACYDAALYQDDHPFTPAQCARLGSKSIVHSWVFNGTAQEYGPNSIEVSHHSEYMIELVRAFSSTPDRSIWLQEVGAPTTVLEAGTIPNFAEETLRSSARCANLWGITWWCSHDVSRKLVGFPEVEYSLGLFDEDGSLKPLGARIKQVVADLRLNPPPVTARNVALIIPVDHNDLPLSRAALAPGGRIFDTWMKLTSQGISPAIALSSDTERLRTFEETIHI